MMPVDGTLQVRLVAAADTARCGRDERAAIVHDDQHLQRGNGWSGTLAINKLQLLLPTDFLSLYGLHPGSEN